MHGHRVVGLNIDGLLEERDVYFYVCSKGKGPKYFVVHCTAVPSIGSDCVYIGLFVFLMCMCVCAGALVFFFYFFESPFLVGCERTRIEFEISFSCDACR